MSIYDDAGVIQIPSAYKKSVSNGTLYSVVPSNGDGDFTFTRGSSATRVNKDGLIEEVSSHIARLDYPLIDGEVQDCPALLLEPSRTNLLIRSEELDNASWPLSGSTVTANQIVSPDGSQNADFLKVYCKFAIKNLHSITSTIEFCKKTRMFFILLLFKKQLKIKTIRKL